MGDYTNITVLVKGTERYIFLYDDDRQNDMLRTAGRFASNPDLTFNWYDAAAISQQVRHAAEDRRRKINLRR